MTDKTNITEMAQFFPTSDGSTRLSRSNKVRVIPWQDGETYEEALARHEAKAARIEAQLAARKSTAAVTL
jgi:hypothetical protein